MSRRQDTHPFAIPLLAAAIALVGGLTYWLFGVGQRVFELALAAALLYGSIVVLTFLVGGVVWAITRFFGSGR